MTEQNAWDAQYIWKVTFSEWGCFMLPKICVKNEPPVRQSRSTLPPPSSGCGYPTSVFCPQHWITSDCFWMQISRYVNNEKYSQSNSSGFVKKLKTFALIFSPISIGCTASQQTQRIWPKGKIVFLQTRLFFFNKRQLLTNLWLLSRSCVRENNDSSKGLGFPFQLSLSFDFCLDEKPLKIPRKKTNWNLNNEDRLLNCYPLRDHIKRKGGAAIPPGNAQVGSHPVKERPAC